MTKLVSHKPKPAFRAIIQGSLPDVARRGSVGAELEDVVFAALFASIQVGFINFHHKIIGV